MTAAHFASMSPKAPAHADHGLRHDRDHHAGARHHHRQRRAALYAGLAVRFPRPDQLGAHLLYRRRRHHDRAGRLDGRPLRPQEAVHHLRRRLHRRFVSVRAGAEHRADGAVPPVAGHGRRRAGAAVAVGAARRLFARRTRLGDGDLGRRRDAGADHRPDAGRLADRQLFLALGVPDQPADRRHHRDRHAAVHGRNAPARTPAFRLVRLHRARHRHRLAAIDARPRRAGRLVRRQRDLDRDDRFDRRLLLFLRPFADDAASRSCASNCSRTAISFPAACSWW